MNQNNFHYQCKQLFMPAANFCLLYFYLLSTSQEANSVMSCNTCSFFHLNKESYFTLLPFFSCKHTVPQQNSNSDAKSKCNFFWPLVCKMVNFQCWHHITTKLCLCNMSCLAEMQSLWKHKMIWSVKAFDKAVKVERHDQIFLRRWCISDTESKMIGCCARVGVCFGWHFLQQRSFLLKPTQGLPLRGQNSSWTNIVVNNTYLFLDFHRVKSKKCCKYTVSSLTRHHNIPKPSNYFQTLFSQDYTHTQKPVWLVMFDLPLLTLSACFYLSFPSGSSLNVWHPEGQLHSAFCTCTKLTTI